MAARTTLTLETAPSFGMTLAVRAREAPDRAAIVASSGNRTFDDLNAHANQFARALRRRGVKPGDVVTLLCPNRAEFLEAYYATVRSGLRVTPINWHLTADEVSYIVNDSESRAFVADARFADTARSVAERAPKLAARFSVGGAIDGFESFDAAIAEESRNDLDDAALGASMLYTSGTTGRPKGVVRTPTATPSQAIATVLELAGYDPARDVHLCTGPLYHAAPLAFSAVQPLNAGVTVVLTDGFKPEHVLELIERHRVTHTHMVPTMFHRLMGISPDVRKTSDLSSLRFVLHGAAPCPPAVKKAVIDWLGPIVVEYYAATEGFGSVVTSHEWLERPGSVGKPLDGQVQVRDSDGAPVPAGEVGTLYLRATDVARFEYFKDPEKTKKTFDGDYFTLGDMGYLDADGYLYLSDRTSDVIISGGVNIYPAEVDAVLLTHPAVADVATVGVPSPEWGEEVKSVVELREHHEPTTEMAAELVAYCRQRLAAFKCPRSVDFVEKLPRFDTGKILRRVVREKYWKGQERKI